MIFGVRGLGFGFQVSGFRFRVCVSDFGFRDHFRFRVVFGFIVGTSFSAMDRTMSGISSSSPTGCVAAAVSGSSCWFWNRFFSGRVRRSGFRDQFFFWKTRYKTRQASTCSSSESMACCRCTSSASSASSPSTASAFAGAALRFCSILSASASTLRGRL